MKGSDKMEYGEITVSYENVVSAIDWTCPICGHDNYFEDGLDNDITECKGCSHVFDNILNELGDTNTYTRTFDVELKKD